MTATTISKELTQESNNTTVETAEVVLARLNFHTRREVIEAARELNPANPLATIVTQKATVIANAVTRSSTNKR